MFYLINYLKSATNSDVDYILQFASPSDDCLATADVIMYGYMCAEWDAARDGASGGS